MSISLQKRIQALVNETLQAPGDWMVWCDPQQAWTPLLQKVANDRRLGGFTLVIIDEWTANRFGGPKSRQVLQSQIATGEHFVLVVPVAQSQLGWLWAQALLAEKRYDRTLRSQLQEWGWRPHSLIVSDEEIALQARSNLTKDPAEWGISGVQSDPMLLLDMFSGLLTVTDDNRFLLTLTIEACGLPTLDEGDIAGWRKRALARLLVTQAHQHAPAVVPDTHPLLIAPEARNVALRLLDTWIDSNRLSQFLPDAILDADRIASLAAGTANATIDVPPFLSHAAERALFVATCMRTAQLQGRALLETFAALENALTAHVHGFWGRRMATSPYGIPWAELQRLSHATRDLLDATPATPWQTPQAAINWYVNGGWRMDQAGEEINRNLDYSTPELVALITPLRAAYRARWEQTLIDWSELWSNAGCPLPPTIASAGSWLKTQLPASGTPTVILVIDALRYDLGAKLAARINQQEGRERATISPARAPFPSITALGMGMALPIDEADFEAIMVDRRWQLRLRGHTENLSLAENRRGWWRNHGNLSDSGFLDIQAIKSNAFPIPSPSCRRLVIHDAALDTLGHDDELEFQGSTTVLDRYLDAIERLRDKSWRRILIVTDHGFIHWIGSDERDAPKPAPDPAYNSRRAVAYPATVALSGPQGVAPGGRWSVAFPRGAASYRAYGGFGYFHGGASLQEWIIPCLAIEWPVAAQPVVVTLEPVDRIMTVRPKVILKIAANGLLLEDAIARQVEVVVRATESFSLLFRSEPLSVSAEQSTQEVTLTQIEGVEAARGSQLRIEVRDPRSEEVLHSIESVLKIELSAW